jgi:two-component system, NtrC family, response regulator GlrR
LTKPRKGNEGNTSATVLSKDSGDRTFETEVVHAEDGSTQLALRRFMLSAVTGIDSGRSFESTAERTAIGSDPTTDVVLADRAVSHFHCEISLLDGQAVIRDLGSTNGTFVDGVRIVEASLHPGARIGIGKTVLVFEPRAAKVRVPLSTRQRFGKLCGRSTAMRRIFDLLEKAAASEATVLLEGETGTEKELAAEAIHTHSSRSRGPLVVVGCGAVASGVLESELFGHEADAFTGAPLKKEGAFEAASGGTLFLDEICELPMELQPKLLRALERREIKASGACSYRSVDVRVIAATGRDLRDAVNRGLFRADLYYSLTSVRLRLPPLRERFEDLPLLVETIVRQLGFEDHPEAVRVMTADFLAQLSRNSWSGNVRELRTFLEHYLAVGEVPRREQTPMVDESLPPALIVTESFRTARASWEQFFERRYLKAILAVHGENVSAAAKAAGLDRIHFYRLLWRNGLR